MTVSYPFPMYSGIFEPKHYKQIGAALWFFSWCINSTTKESEDEDGVRWGHVLGKKPMKLSELAEPFGVNDKTVSRWVDTLEEHGYIRTIRAPYGLIISVKNSKKRTDKIVRSELGEQTKLSDHSPREQTDMSDHPDINVRSNKDFELNISSSSAVITDEEIIIRRSLEIERHFCMRRGKGFNVSAIDFDAIKEIVAEGTPVDLIKSSIDISFEEYKPKHKRDEIRTITYCLPRCYDEWEKRKTNDSITSPTVPSVGSVALGSPSRRTKQQRDLDELDRMQEEAIQREQVGCY